MSFAYRQFKKAAVVVLTEDLPLTDLMISDTV